MKTYETLDELQASTQARTGLLLNCRENLYYYIVQPSGYTASGDDITFANGRVGKASFIADAEYIKTPSGSVQEALDSIVAGSLPAQARNKNRVLTTDGTNASWADAVLTFSTVTQMEALEPDVFGIQAICEERSNARYILRDQASYVAQAGDITATNGRVWALQIDAKGMDVLSFGDSFDSAIVDAVNRMAGVADIIISGEHTTSGVSFSSINGVSLKGDKNSKLSLSDSADKAILRFTTCNNVHVSGLEIDGNRSNQTATTTSSAAIGAAMFFEFCDGVYVEDCEVYSPASSTVRARNCQNIYIDGVNGSDGGYIPYYIGANASGSDMFNIEVKNCNYDWSTVDREISEMGTIAIGTDDFNCIDVNVENNTLYQSNDTPSGFHASIGLRGVLNGTVIGNRVHNGGIPITIVRGCDNITIANNTIDTETTLYAIEIAGGMTNWTVSGNTITSATSYETGVQVNGGSSNGAISGNVINNCDIGVVILGPDTSTLSTNITMNGNNIVSGTFGYSFRNCEKISVNGGSVKNSGGTTDINMQDARKITVSGVTVESSATYFGRVSGTTIVNTDTLFTGNNVRDLANNRYIFDTTGGAGIGARIRYQGESLTIHDLQTFVLDATDSGNPEGIVIAGVGSTFKRTDGGAGSTFYVKETGAGNAGWVAK